MADIEPNQLMLPYQNLHILLNIKIILIIIMQNHKKRTVTKFSNILFVYLFIHYY